MTAQFTREQIESVIARLPIQGRIMMHLLLLQYFEVPQEEIEYMQADRPDPRMAAGSKRIVSVISKDALQGITDRVVQYQSQTRRKRERLWLLCQCLERQIHRTQALIAAATRLLTTRFHLGADALQEVHSQAGQSILKPVVRELNGRWERNEIEEEEYRARRLIAEYQTLLRKLGRDRKRLEVSQRDFDRVNRAPLQDHEVAHIWGLPAGSLAARKVKYLTQYLEDLQKSVEGGPLRSLPQDTHADLWKETFSVLATSPVERSVAPYDGLEHTESALLEKLGTLASGALSEELESRFWLPVSLSLYTLQRLAVIQSEWDLSMEAVEEELLARISPAPKQTQTELSEEDHAQRQLGVIGEHVLRSMLGEERQ